MSSIRLNLVRQELVSRFWLCLCCFVLLLALQPAMSLAASIAITRQPVNATVKSGETAQFSVGLASSDQYTYQWYRESEKVSGGTSRWLTLKSVTRSQAGRYRVRVSQGTLFTYSEYRTLTVDGYVTPTTTTSSTSSTTTATSSSTSTTSATPSINATTSITITRQPVPVTVAVGTTFQMSVGVDGEGKEYFTYQWFKDGQKVSGGTTRWLTVKSPTTSSSGYYKVVVTNTKGSVTSNSAYAKVGSGVVVVSNEPVVDTTSKVKISLQPMDAAVFTGKSVSLNVSATSDYALAYQWRKNGVAISGANLSYLTINPAAVSDSGKYDVIVSDKYGSLTSSAATLTVTVDRKAALTWTAPTSRTSGVALKTGEIQMYRLYHTTTDGSVEQVHEVDANIVSFELNNLQDGTHNFAITAVDTGNRESDFSVFASKTIK